MMVAARQTMIEFISAGRNRSLAPPLRISVKLSQVNSRGKYFPSAWIEDGLTAREKIQNSGIRVHSMTGIETANRLHFCLGLSSMSPPLLLRPGEIDVEALLKDQGYGEHSEEEQHRDRRSHADLHSVDGGVVGQQRQCCRVVGPARHDEDVVKDAEGVKGAEEHRD